MLPSTSHRDLQCEILSRIARGEDLESTLDDLCLLIQAGIPDSICTVMLLDPDSGMLRTCAAPELSEDARALVDGIIPGPLAGSCGTAVHTGKVTIVSDVANDPRWESLRDVALQLGIAACWSTPIFCKEGRAIGSLAIARTLKGGPSEQDDMLLNTAATVAQLAIQRERGERERVQQRALLASILESANDPIFAKDLSGRYLLCNGAEATGVALEAVSIIGKRDIDLYTPEQAKRIREWDAEVVRTGRSVEYRESFESAAIGRRTYFMSKNPLRDAEGKICGIVGVARDVTELERAEEAMHHAQQIESLAVLAGGVAHDFNNLLTGILGNASLALGEVPADSHIAKNLIEIENSALRAAELTSQMLAYAGRGETRREVIDLEALVEDVAQLTRSTLSPRARMHLDLASELPQIYGDPTQIRQVVMNLLTNASDSLENGDGDIWLELGTHEEGVELHVTDSGAGMNEETRLRVFDPFFTTKSDGRGLGLAAVHGIAHTHGGRVGVRSVLGEGTRFSLWFPPLDPARIPRPVPAVVPEPTETVLVVDDEASVRSLARRTLKRDGYAVVEAENGVEALEYVRAHPDEVDAIVLDLRMPGCPGDEVLFQLQQEGIAPPTVISSGFDEREIQAKLHPAPFFLPKPYRPAQLLDSVQRALRLSGNRTSHVSS